MKYLRCQVSYKVTFGKLYQAFFVLKFSVLLCALILLRCCVHVLLHHFIRLVLKFDIFLRLILWKNQQEIYLRGQTGPYISFFFLYLVKDSILVIFMFQLEILDSIFDVCLDMYICLFNCLFCHQTASLQMLVVFLCFFKKKLFKLNLIMIFQSVSKMSFFLEIFKSIRY